MGVVGPLVSRRRLLTQTSLGFGITVAAAPAVPRAAVTLFALPKRQSAASLDVSQGAPPARITLLEPMVIHVGDVATAKIAVMVGIQERRVADDVLTIELRALAGATIPLVDPAFVPDPHAADFTDGVTPANINSPFLASFPYPGVRRRVGCLCTPRVSRARD